jgi:hypothetical protein
MVDGTKPADRHPSERDARSPRPLAYLVAGVALAAGVWAVTRYDPQAFTLRSAESYEHQGERGTADQAEDQDDD